MLPASLAERILHSLRPGGACLVRRGYLTLFRQVAKSLEIEIRVTTKRKGGRVLFKVSRA